MTNRSNLKMFTGGGEPYAAGGRVRLSRSSYSPSGGPICVSCERKWAAVLKAFPPDVPLRMPAQVFPVCGGCALLGEI